MGSPIKKSIIALNNKVALKDGETPNYLGELSKNFNINNLLLNGNFEYWYAGTNSAPDGWTLYGTNATITREEIIKKVNSYSAKLTRSGTDCSLYQRIDINGLGINYYKGRTVTVSMWIYATVADRVHFYVSDGVGQTNSTFHTGDSTWQLITVTHTVSENATDLYVQCRVITGDTSGYFDGVMCVEGSIPFAYQPHIEDHLYKQDNMSFGYTSCQTGDSIATHNAIINTT
ncbi:MAG: hypothetical protein ACTSPD_09695, partial [Promethearchaeota archaeon]